MGLLTMPLTPSLRRPSNTIILLFAAAVSVVLVFQVWRINVPNIALPAGHFIPGGRHANINDINNATLGVCYLLPSHPLTLLTCWR